MIRDSIDIAGQRRRTRTRAAWWALTAVLGAGIGVVGAERAALGEEKDAQQKIDPKAAEFFETQVRPVLAENCYSCHGPQAQSGKLRLDGRAFLLRGGESGPSLVPGHPEKSLLLDVVRHVGKIQMPPGGKLKPEQIEALDAWVKMGAPWPGAAVADEAKAAAATGEYRISDAQRKFWAFQPVRKPAPPAVKNAAWAKTPLDRFVLAKLEAKGLKPSPAADRRTLIRRATFDMHGLPPTPEEVEAFAADKSPDAWAKVVNRLLASPRYGERWGRHWLDIARYADTKGYVFVDDRNYPHAYNYRDWVVRAFNNDLPYDQFVMQQLAADRLPLGEDRRPLAALGYLTVGRRFLNQQHDIIDDRIDVTMRGFQAMTVACARCHDHKFDPIPTKDYYSLYGVFASSHEPEPQPISPRHISEPYGAHHKQVQDTEREEAELVRSQVAALRERAKDPNAALPDGVRAALQSVRENERPGGDNLVKIEATFEPPVREKLGGLRQSLERLRKSYPPKPEMAMTMADNEKPVTPRVFRRGNPGNQGDEVPRRFLAILSKGDQRPAWDKGSGRLELARAIASRENPLTARVMVNRIWLHHFGAGLVRTPSDFGKQGERPTHSELLDYLAASFMDSGWSIKKVHRMILTSATYGQSSRYDARAFARDPENRLLWRTNRRRLELEALRDSLLWASGQMDTTMGGPSVDLWKPPYTSRRTVYGFIERQNLPGVFRTFDFASPDVSVGQRFATTVPQQALFLLNSPFAAEQARRLAARPEVTEGKDEAARVRRLYRLLYNRGPDAEEMKLALGFLRTASGPGASEEPVWRYGYGTFDAAKQRVADFAPLPHWTGQSWQGGKAAPDPVLGWATLTAKGGHPGGVKHAVVRRWTAPADGEIAISGTLRHPGKEGDGVQGRIVSSRAGLLGTWTAQNGEAATMVEKTVVKRGDTVDFIVECRTNESFDSFEWAPTVKTANSAQRWSAEANFGGPPAKGLNAWERYAQALLMTNEFIFVD